RTSARNESYHRQKHPAKSKAKRKLESHTSPQRTQGLLQVYWRGFATPRTARQSGFQLLHGWFNLVLRRAPPHFRPQKRSEFREFREARSGTRFLWMSCSRLSRRHRGLEQFSVLRSGQALSRSLFRD